METKHFAKLHGEGKMTCTICPRQCRLKEGRLGWCGARERIDDKNILRTYGLVSSSHPDPIEKKPLYHYSPGTYTYSLGTIGCTLACLQCQNWSISQERNIERLRRLSPEAAIEGAQKSNCPSISLTYNEPLIWYEYIVDIYNLANEKGLEILLVTNGYATEELAREVSQMVSAANVDVKSFRDEFYMKICRGKLDPVLRTCKIFKENGVHVEITNLVIPSKNDSEEGFRDLARWVVDELGPDTPLHFSKFHPDYKLNDVPPTPVSTIETAKRIAEEEGVFFVYVGNIAGHGGNNTYCPSCNQLLVERRGFDIKQYRVEKGLCPTCNHKIPIMGKPKLKKRRRWLS